MYKQKTNKIRNEKYNEYVKSVTPLSSTFKSVFHAFLIGGLTCLIGQIISEVIALLFPQLEMKMVVTITLMIIITIAILFTGLGFFDAIARIGGAGSFLPITGFANAMSSASMEFKSEGLIFGTSVKLFSVVGPVVVNGIVWSTVAGLLTLLWEAIF